MPKTDLPNYPKKGFKKPKRVDDPDPSFNYHLFEYSNIAVLFVDESPIHYKDRLYAMKNDECRGVAIPLYFPPLDKYVWYLMTYSNQEGEPGLHLEYYSFKRGHIKYAPDWDFVADDIIGHAMEPRTIKFIKGVQ